MTNKEQFNMYKDQLNAALTKCIPHLQDELMIECIQSVTDEGSRDAKIKHTYLDNLLNLTISIEGE